MAQQGKSLYGSAKQQAYLPTLKPRVFRNFSLGRVGRTDSAVAPSGSFRMALNMDSDYIIGALASRLGTTVLGGQIDAGEPCLGIGNYIRTQLDASYTLSEDGTTMLAEDGGQIYTEAVGKKLFAAFPTANDNTVFDVLDGTVNLTGDTQGVRTRFCSYLDSIVRMNGWDACKAYNNLSWITTGGVFDLSNMPLFQMGIEFKTRIYGFLLDSDILYYSSVTDSTLLTINWTVSATDTNSAGHILVSPEDGGGGITALEKVPGYLLIFKQRALKRWDGSTLNPEDLIGQGVYYQECVTRSRELVYFINQYGIWTTNGGYPVRISRPVQDFVEAITDWSKVTCVGDDLHVLFALGNVTVNGVTYNNAVLKYNVEEQTWDVRSYANNFQYLSRYIDVMSHEYLIAGDNNGDILLLDTGTTDTGTPIPWTVEPHPSDWGIRGNLKAIQDMYVYSQDISTGKVLWKPSDSADYKPFGKISKEVEYLNLPENSVTGNYFDFKFTGIASTQRAIFQGYEFSPESVIYIENTNA